MLHLITERLELVELSAYNAAFIVELLNSPGWLQFIGDRNVHSSDDAVSYLIKGPFKIYEQHNFGPLLLRLRDTNQCIGICGLFQRDYLSYPDIGFALLPAFEGAGYAYEAASAVLQGASGHGFTTVGAILTHGNERSFRLLERLGFAEVGMITPPGGDEQLLLMEAALSAS